jgi:hypothetical protein
MEDVIQIVGAVLILTAFVAAQRGAMSPRAPGYLWLNLSGSAVLAVIAAAHADWGFLLLEGVWAIVSGWSLIELARGRAAPELP